MKRSINTRREKGKQHIIHNTEVIEGDLAKWVINTEIFKWRKNLWLEGKTKIDTLQRGRGRVEGWSDLDETDEERSQMKEKISWWRCFDTYCHVITEDRGATWSDITSCSWHARSTHTHTHTHSPSLAAHEPATPTPQSACIQADNACWDTQFQWPLTFGSSVCKCCTLWLPACLPRWLADWLAAWPIIVRRGSQSPSYRLYQSRSAAWTPGRPGTSL